MNVQTLATLLDAVLLTDEIGVDNEITCGYTCDLLSWVMANSEEHMAWITVQTHINVIAVAALADMACVILPENIAMEKECIEKAKSQGLPILQTKLNAYQAVAVMVQNGIAGRQ